MSKCVHCAHTLCVLSLIDVKAAIRASQRLALSEAAGVVDKIINEPLNSVWKRENKRQAHLRRV